VLTSGLSISTGSIMPVVLYLALDSTTPHNLVVLILAPC